MTEQELQDYPGETLPPDCPPVDKDNPFYGLIPEDQLMAGPWYSCLMVTVANPEAMKEFQDYPGETLPPDCPPVDKQEDSDSE